MAQLLFTARISAPPDRVWAFFVPQRMPYWFGKEMDAELEVQGGAADFAAGQKVRISGRLGRREVSLTAVVTACEPGRLLEWRFHDAYGVRGTQRWDLTPEGEGTQVAMRDDYELPRELGRFARLLDALYTRHAVARRDRAWLAALARLAQRT